MSQVRRPQHPNAALTPAHRLKMVRLVVEEGWSVPAVAQRFQVDDKTVRKWCDRYRAEGAAGLEDRSRPAAATARTAHPSRCVVVWSSCGATPAAGRGSSPTRRACTPRRCTASASLRDWAASTEATAAPARPPNRCAMSAKRLVRWCTSTSRNSQRSPTAAAGAPTDEATPDPANARDGATSTPP